MSYSETNFDENGFDRLINVTQLMSAPIASFALMTPLCIWSGYSVATAFLIGWVFGLLAMMVLILSAYAFQTIREIRETARQTARANVALMQSHLYASDVASPVAEWHFDSLADRLDAMCQTALSPKHG